MGVMKANHDVMLNKNNLKNVPSKISSEVPVQCLAQNTVFLQLQSTQKQSYSSKYLSQHCEFCIDLMKFIPKP